MKKNSAVGSQPVTRLIWILLTIFFVIIVIHLVKRDFNHDEFEAVHTAWKIQQGEKIFVDFFQHHHPFYYYLLIPVLVIFGQTITAVFAMRLVSLVMLALMLFVTYRLSLTIFSDRQKALCSVLLLSGALIFINRAIESRPDVPQTLFGLLSLLFLFIYFENRSLKWLLLSSVSLAIAFLFLQKAIFLIALIGCLLLLNVYKKHLSYRDFLSYIFAFLLILAPYYVYLVCSGSLSSYFTFNWVLNTKFVCRFTPFDAIGFALQTSTLMCIFYVWGLLKFCKKPSHIRIGWFSLGLLASTFFIATPYKQSFMMALPLISLISANAIYLLFQRKPKWMFVVLFFAVVVPAFLLLIRARDNNVNQLKIIDYVLSVTDKDDYVYDGNANFNVFRKDVDFFWFSLRPRVGGLAAYKTIAQYEYNIYKSIEKNRPKLISNYQIEDMQHEAIAGHYVQSDKFENLFIRKNDL